MITWLMFTFLNPGNHPEIVICACSGVWFDMFLLGWVYGKIEKIIDNHRKNR